MTIEYKNIHDFSEQDLKDLFLSVEWSSGHFPDKLVVAMKNFKTVISAWDGDKLVGMICAMDDGIMNAYVHYLLVRPRISGQGHRQSPRRQGARKIQGLPPHRRGRLQRRTRLLRTLWLQESRRRKPDVYYQLVDVSYVLQAEQFGN